MSDKSTTERKYLYYKDDFDFTLILPDKSGVSTELPFPDYDFTVRVFTTGFNGFKAYQRGGECVNCFNDNGRIHIVCDSHGLSVGDVQVEFLPEIPNAIYPDGSQLVGGIFDTDITLSKTQYDEWTDTEVTAILPYIKGEKGDKGDAFTYADFTADEIAELQQPAIDAANAATELMGEFTTAEQTRQNNEQQRIGNETLRGTMENERVLSEESRLANENERQTAENERNTAEGERIKAESARVANEQFRDENEDTRIENEEARKVAEAERIEAEKERIANDESATDNELERMEVEKQRVAAENERASAEQTRSEAFSDLSTQMTEAIDRTTEATAQTQQATMQAKEAALIAMNAVNEANEQASYAKEQGDYAKRQAALAREAAEKGSYTLDFNTDATQATDFNMENCDIEILSVQFINIKALILTIEGETLTEAVGAIIPAEKIAVWNIERQTEGLEAAIGVTYQRKFE